MKSKNQRLSEVLFLVYLIFIPERSLPLLSEAKVGDEFRSSHNLKLFLKTFSY